MPQEILTEETARAVALPQTALLGTGERHTRRHGLHQELREYRAEAKFQQAIDIAASMTNDGITDLRNVRTQPEADSFRWETERQYGVSINDIDAGFPTTRLALKGLGETVGVPDLIQQTRGMKLGDRLSFDSGKGFILNGIHNGQTSWSVEFAKGLDPGAAESTLREFYGSFQAATAKTFNARDEIRKGLSTKTPVSYSSQEFSWKDEADEIVSLLTNAAMPHTLQGGAAMQRARVVEALYDLPAHYAGDPPSSGELRERGGIYFDAHGRIEKVLVPTYEQGVYYGLLPAQPGQTGDLTELSLKIGMEVYEDETYIQLASSKRHSEGTVPFVETDTAIQLLGAFEKAKLQINSSLRDVITETNIETIYGLGYSHLTREIAKLVDDRDRSLGRLFEDDGDIAAKIRALEAVDDPAARIVIDLLKGVVDRAPAPEGLPVLPVSSDRIYMGDGSCRDIEEYLAAGGLRPAAHGLPEMLISTYAVKTGMLMGPASLNGVRVPAGTLVAIRNDGYLMMRVTSFAFSAAEALHVFGAQEVNNRRATAYDQNRQAIRAALKA